MGRSLFVFLFVLCVLAGCNERPQPTSTPVPESKIVTAKKGNQKMAGDELPK